MVTPMAPFDYTQQFVDGVVASLSEDRLTPYLRQSKGDRVKAIKLYERNIAVSEGFYSIIHVLEIALRNTVHRTLSKQIAEEWFDQVGLSAFSAKNVAKARENIRKRGKDLTASRIVAELGFGFWADIFRVNGLWMNHLHHAFPGRQRKDIHVPVDAVRKFRNRISHQESILARNLSDDYARIMWLIAEISPETAQWADRQSRLQAWHLETDLPSST
ncbi:hypothetical protein [Thalassospira povalilytica]|uniref:hypothetical protein n=1 Tax=Thalassospira povalilytica TaxID=732237 RepID=UPI003AA9B828